MRTDVLLALALTACSSSSRSSAAGASPEAVAPVATGPASTGPLTEAEFKALHAPPTEGPAVRNGQTIELAGGTAYLSVPPGPGPFPAIVVIHEWWGLNANIEHWADRLASVGWAALAVDLYGKVATTPDEAMAAMKAVDEAKAAAVITAGLDFLATEPRVRATTRAVIGWCFGGGWSLRTAIAHPTLDGAIIYYGQPELDPAKLGAIKARVLGIFATRDKGIPNDQVDAFEAALARAGVRAQLERYDAEHAFANPSNPRYDEPAASDAWTHVLAFLAALRR